MSQRMLRCYLNSDLRCGHQGLSDLAKKDGIRVKDLAPGEMIVFVNAKRDRVKVYASSNVLAYLRLERGSIDLNTIREIPKAFQGSGKIDYDKALKETVESALMRRAAQKRSNLAAPLTVMRQGARE